MLNHHKMEKMLSESNLKNLGWTPVPKVDTGRCKTWKEVASKLNLLGVAKTGQKGWLQNLWFWRIKFHSIWIPNFVLTFPQPPLEGTC